MFTAPSSVDSAATLLIALLTLRCSLTPGILIAIGRKVESQHLLCANLPRPALIVTDLLGYSETGVQPQSAF